MMYKTFIMLLKSFLFVVLLGSLCTALLVTIVYYQNKKEEAETYNSGEKNESLNNFCKKTAGENKNISKRQIVVNTDQLKIKKTEPDNVNDYDSIRGNKGVDGCFYLGMQTDNIGIGVKPIREDKNGTVILHKYEGKTKDYCIQNRDKRDKKSMLKKHCTQKIGKWNYVYDRKSNNKPSKVRFSKAKKKLITSSCFCKGGFICDFCQPKPGTVIETEIDNITNKYENITGKKISNNQNENKTDMQNIGNNLNNNSKVHNKTTITQNKNTDEIEDITDQNKKAEFSNVNPERDKADALKSVDKDTLMNDKKRRNTNQTNNEPCLNTEMIKENNDYDKNCDKVGSKKITDGAEKSTKDVSDMKYVELVNKEGFEFIFDDMCGEGQNNTEQHENLLPQIPVQKQDEKIKRVVSADRVNHNSLTKEQTIEKTTEERKDGEKNAGKDDVEKDDANKDVEKDDGDKEDFVVLDMKEN